MALDAEDRLKSSVEIFTVELTQEGTTAMIALSGECDLSRQQRFRAAIGEALAARPECIVLDLSHLSFIDSTGIAVVVELGKTTERDGVHLVICPGADQVQRIFELCGLTSRLPFLPTGRSDGRAA